MCDLQASDSATFTGYHKLIEGPIKLCPFPVYIVHFLLFLKKKRFPFYCHALNCTVGNFIPTGSFTRVCINVPDADSLSAAELFHAALCV